MFLKPYFGIKSHFKCLSHIDWWCYTCNFYDVVTAENKYDNCSSSVWMHHMAWAFLCGVCIFSLQLPDGWPRFSVFHIFQLKSFHHELKCPHTALHKTPQITFMQCVFFPLLYLYYTILEKSVKMALKDQKCLEIIVWIYNVKYTLL